MLGRTARAGATLVLVLATLLLAATAEAARGPAKARVAPSASPIVIGHRGAPAYRPEHTLASYRLAISMGADFIEPDLVSTKDHQLVARHENDITETTDVAQHAEFAARKTTKVIDGVSHTGWFTEDFTLAELKTLRAIERLPATRPTNTAFNGQFEVPTLQEVIDLAKKEHVGIYPETKHPTYFDGIGLSLEEPLVRTLRRNGLRGRRAPVYIQSFEVSNLEELSRSTRFRLVQLIDVLGRPADFTAAGDPRTYADLVTPAGLREVATYADGIGPDKTLIVPRTAAGALQPPTTLITDAHRLGLVVHPYTFRPENEFLSAAFRLGNPASPEFLRARGDQPAELALYYRLGVDGVFADNPDTAVAVRQRVFGRR